MSPHPVPRTPRRGAHQRSCPGAARRRAFGQAVLTGLLLAGLGEPAAAAPAAGAAPADSTRLLQDFETRFDIGVWPPDPPEGITFQRDGQAIDGQALRIPPEVMAAFGDLRTHDWRGYQILRLRIRNDGAETASVGFELQDEHTTYHERHQDGFGVPPGAHTVELDISGDLWRGEENHPYRGQVKTPIDIGGITRIGFYNHGDGPLFLDDLELVRRRRPAVPGGFAFDFGRAGTPVPFPWTGVSHDLAFDAARGYGLLGDGARALSRNMSFPTSVLGDGIALGEEGFRVDLPGGDYTAWIAFERGGFWEDQAAGYARAEVLVNDAVVHGHDFAVDGPQFYFQDTEITDLAQLRQRLIWPAHAVARFTFHAAAGANVVQVRAVDAVGWPLRLAGLVLAPDTEAGAAFVDDYAAQQRRELARTFASQDRSRQASQRRPPTEDLVVARLVPGEQVYPRDWPPVDGLVPGRAPTDADADEAVLAVRGQVVSLQLGVYARHSGHALVAADALQGPGLIPPSRIAHGRYLPMRPYGTGVTWLEINHFRPEPTFDVGPELTRAVVVDYRVPADAAPGDYRANLRVRLGGDVVTVPIRVHLLDLDLPPVPIPVGLFMNALPFGPERVGPARWWSWQEALLIEQLGAGLNTLTGGGGLRYQVGADADGHVEIDGERPRQYLRRAQRLAAALASPQSRVGDAESTASAPAGTGSAILAVVPYGGFLPHLRNLADLDPDSLAAAVARLSTDEGLPPHYVYAYDEPGTAAETEPVLGWLEPTAGTGLRTIGYTSWHGEDDALWWRLIRASRAPAFNNHTGPQLRRLRQLGHEPWVYNNGQGRLAFGLRLWRSMALGAAGRLEWIGLFTQGFAFDNLDGREPSRSCFLAHGRYGPLPTPLWLATREGLVDLRLRLALEQAVDGHGASATVAVRARARAALALWMTAGYRQDADAWTEARLRAARRAMVEALAALSTP